MSDEKKSGPVLEILPCYGQHISALKVNLQTGDANEILRFGVSINHALWLSYRQSITRKTALIDGTVAACWGLCGSIIGQTGKPWLMTTPEVKRISPLRFARVYQEEVLRMLTLFPRLENYCDAEYSSAIRLLEIIGFTIEKPEKIGNGMYCRFWME